MKTPKQIMKKTILCAAIAGLLTTVVNAADITWQTPTTISGASDVSTTGVFVGSWAPGDDWRDQNGVGQLADNFPVNGVVFNAYGSGPFNSFISQSGFDGRYNGFNSPGTADGNYNTILNTGEYSNGATISMTWGGMTAGNIYELEFWVNDGRNSVTAERIESLTGGANTSAALAYGFGDNGPGQFILGTFVADGTGTETLTINAAGGADIGASAQINLMQLRDVTVPEPSTLAFLAIGAGMTIVSIRRKNRVA